MSQTNLVSIPNVANASSSTAAQTFQSQTNQALSIAERIQQVRAVCIQNRRSICGKILKILPDGLVVESGYTNLLRVPINRSWLAPGTVTANRAPSLIEENEPASVCVGQVFLTDYPKSRRLKPKVLRRCHHRRLSHRPIYIYLRWKCPKNCPQIFRRP